MFFRGWMQVRLKADTTYDFTGSSAVEPVPSAPQSSKAADAASNATLVYVGTYTGAKSKGIYLFRLQTENLEVSQNILLVPLGLAAATPNPSFLELDLKRRCLFAVNELQEFEG